MYRRLLILVIIIFFAIKGFSQQRLIDSLENQIAGQKVKDELYIQMPEKDGITATQKLKEKHDNIPPIIGLSANVFEGAREKYMEEGVG